MSGSIELDGEDYAALQERIQALEQQNAALETENQQLRIELAWLRDHQDVQKLVDAARAMLRVYGVPGCVGLTQDALAEALKPFEQEKQG